MSLMYMKQICKNLQKCDPILVLNNQELDLSLDLNLDHGMTTLMRF